MKRGSYTRRVILILRLLQPTNFLAFEYSNKENRIDSGSGHQKSKLSMVQFSDEEER